MVPFRSKIARSSNTKLRCERCVRLHLKCDDQRPCGQCRKRWPYHLCSLTDSHDISIDRHQDQAEDVNAAAREPRTPSLSLLSAPSSTAILVSRFQESLPLTSQGCASTPMYTTPGGSSFTSSQTIGLDPISALPTPLPRESPILLLPGHKRRLRLLRDIYIISYQQMQVCSTMDAKLRISIHQMAGKSMVSERQNFCKLYSALDNLNFEVEKLFNNIAKYMLSNSRNLPEEQRKGFLWDVWIYLKAMLVMQPDYLTSPNETDFKFEQSSKYLPTLLQKFENELLGIWSKEGNHGAVDSFFRTQCGTYTGKPSQHHIELTDDEIEWAKSDARDALEICRGLASKVLKTAHERTLTNCPFSVIQFILLTRRKEVAEALINVDLNLGSERDALDRNILHQLVDLNDINLLNVALRNFPHAVKEKDRFGMTAAAVAAYLGHKEALSLLLEADRICEDALDLGSRRLICAASAAGNDNIVAYLLNRGHQAMSLLDVERCPLIEAALAGHLSVVEVLLKGGANPRWHKPIVLSHLARANGHDDVADILQEAEAKCEDSTGNLKAWRESFRPMQLTASNNSHAFSQQQQQQEHPFPRSSGDLLRNADDNDSPNSWASGGGHSSPASSLLFPLRQHSSRARHDGFQTVEEGRGEKTTTIEQQQQQGGYTVRMRSNSLGSIHQPWQSNSQQNYLPVL